MDFAVHPWRFTLKARDRIHFPAGKISNGLRGGFGAALRRVGCSCTVPHRANCEYAGFFEPRSEPAAVPSGLVDPPRPFVLRATHLDGQTFESGETFGFDLHVFIRHRPPLSLVVSAVEELAATGFGPGRAKAELSAGPANSPPTLIPLAPPSEPVCQIPVRFVTATELKLDGEITTRPDFPILFARARDRVATLSALYGASGLALDFAEMGERAQSITMTRCNLRHVDAARRSGRTGQRHPLSGFLGDVQYEGPLTEFLPILKAAEWTGVGRQTVWGKGAIRLL